ncbi:hypothetical protein C1N53_03230 [Pontibacter sp. SGAir0037]|nr:hypothetical protein C1N53_03230 [Pontibacter sp. SGAir0037]
MTQREVTDQDGTTWTCVQAYGGLSKEKADKATELAEAGKGTVTVVCTPSGGAQTIRLQLPPSWEETTSEEQLLAAIEQENT